MKKSPKKMVLTRETLHQLTSDQAQAALGGYTVIQKIPDTSDSVKICCA